MITPLPPQLRPDHPSIAIADSARRHQSDMRWVRRAMTAAAEPDPAPADDRTLCQRIADDTALYRAQQQAIDLVTGDGPGEPT